MEAAGSLAALREVRELLGGLPSFEVELLDVQLRELAVRLGLKAGQLFGIIRVAVTGQQVAPPLFGTLSVLGRGETLARIDAALGQLEALAA
jgi:glutamyl-tRNA synthetase